MTVVLPADGSSGRRAPRPGTARSALAHRAFTLVWFGTMASNVGTWMQNVALGALAYSITRSASFVALLQFAQLGPILVLSTVGGLIADRLDRRSVIIAMNTVQLALSLVLAAVAIPDSPSRTGILAVVFAIGVCNALQGPAMSSYLPMLVPRADMPGAISLFSVQMNLSRVVGPALGGLLLPYLGFAGLFVINALTYLFAIGGVAFGPPAPRPAPRADDPQGWRRITSGFSIARGDSRIGGPLVAIAFFSFFCLPFIGLMPVVAEENLGLDVKGVAYGLLYSCFGLGAASGAMAVGSVLVGRSRMRVLRVSLACFAVLLAVWGVLGSAAVAYPLLFALGASYFVIPTTLSTSLQEHLPDEKRGRVMALYMMGFGGIVPIGILVFGRLSDEVGLGPVLACNAAAALVLMVGTRLHKRPEDAAPDYPPGVEPLEATTENVG